MTSESIGGNWEQKRQEKYEVVDRKVDILKDIMSEVEVVTRGDAKDLYSWAELKVDTYIKQFPQVEKDIKHIFGLRKQITQKEKERRAYGTKLDREGVVEESQTELEQGEELFKLRSEIQAIKYQDDNVYCGYQIVRFLESIVAKKGEVKHAEDLWREDKTAFFNFLREQGWRRYGFVDDLEKIYKEDPGAVNVEVDGIHCMLKVNRPILGKTTGTHRTGTPLLFIDTTRGDQDTEGTIRHEQNHNYFDILDINTYRYADEIKEYYRFYKRIHHAIPAQEPDELLEMIENVPENLQGEMFADMERIFDQTQTSFMLYMSECRSAIKRIIVNEPDPFLKEKMQHSYNVLIRKLEDFPKELNLLVEESKREGRESDLKALLVMFGADLNKVKRHFHHTV